MMNKNILFLIAIFIFNPVQVQADCKEILMDVNKEYQDVYLNSENQRNIRQLRKVAISLHKLKKEPLCAKIVEDIELRLSSLEKRQGVRQRIAYLKNASRPMTTIKHNFSAEEIIGARMINIQDEQLGSIEGISINSQTGKLDYIVMSHGGVLGLGEKYIGIPWDKLNWLQEEDVYVIDVPMKLLEKAPDIGETAWPQQVDFSWLNNPE